MTENDKKNRLVNSAALLFHTRGLANTSLADIAKHADIPIGNVYYYFKTKEELAIAAVIKHKEEWRAIYNALEEHVPNPRERLIEALHYVEKMRDEYTRYGCPIGKIIVDGDDEKDAVVQAAAQVLIEFVSWARQQFERLGHKEEAKRYATSLVAGIEGAAILAKATRNSEVMTDEIARLTHWVSNLPNLKIQLGKVALKPNAA